MNLNRVVIIGAGAIGGTIGGALSEAGVSVELVARGQHGEAIRKHGLAVRFHDRTLRASPVCHDHLESVGWRAGDIAVVATKLGDAQQVMDDLLRIAGSQLPIVCASNGVQGERWAKERFETVLSMLVWLPSTHLSPGDVRVYLESKSPGVLDVGPSQGELATPLSDRLCEFLRQANFDSVCRSDIRAWKYAKLITNLGSAAQAMVVDDWQSIAELARAEGEGVLSNLGIDRVATKKLLDRTSHLKLLTIDGQKRLGGSTWQSRQRGRPLESKWIEGEIARLAEEAGLSAPINRFLTDASESPRDLLAQDVLNANIRS